MKTTKNKTISPRKEIALQKRKELLSKVLPVLIKVVGGTLLVVAAFSGIYAPVLQAINEYPEIVARTFTLLVVVVVIGTIAHFDKSTN